MCLIPKENINLSRLIFFVFSIEVFKFFEDSFPHPSKFDILLKSKL